jgi:hypothetical protein
MEESFNALLLLYSAIHVNKKALFGLSFESESLNRWLADEQKRQPKAQENDPSQ